MDTPEPGYLDLRAQYYPTSVTAPGGFFAELTEDRLFWAVFAAGDDPNVDDPVDGGLISIDTENPGTLILDHVPALMAGLYDLYAVLDVDEEPGVSGGDFIGQWMSVEVLSGQTTSIEISERCITGVLSIDPQIVGEDEVVHLHFGLFKWEEEGAWFNSMGSHGWDVTGPGPHRYLTAGPADEPRAHFLLAFIEPLPGDGHLSEFEYYSFYGYADVDAAMAGGPNVDIDGELLDSYDFTIDQSYTEKVAAPTFSPSEGDYDSGQEVTISCETAGATIYYSVDEGPPTTASTKYTAPIPLYCTALINEDKVVYAFAVKDGWIASDVVWAIYTIWNPSF
jgi:hypothetical protein